MIAQIGLIGLSLWVAVDATVAARVTILVGVTAFITAFLRFDDE